MAFRSGKDSDAKKLLIRLPEERGDDELYLLDKSQIKALLSLSASIGWRTRHLAFPSYVNTSDKLQSWADETALDLMTPIDFCSQLASCEDEIAAIMANLIATNMSVQDALRQFISNDTEIINNIVKPQPLPIENLTDTDDLDILFAQCVAIVEYTHNAINDLFDILEVQSNNVELMSNIKLIPGMQVLLDASGAGQFILLLDYLLSTLNEQYDAQWEETPPTGTKWIIACKIFCACKEDKVITVARIYDAIGSLVNQYTTISWDNLSEIVETIVGVNDNSEVMVYITHLMLWGTARFAGKFGIESLNSSILKVLLALADSPNNDWEILCEDCSEPEPPDEECLDLTVSKHGFVEQGGTTYSTGEGFIATYYSFYNESLLRVFYEGSSFTSNIGKVIVTFSIPVTNVLLYQQGGGTSKMYTGTASTEIEFSSETFDPWTDFNPAFGLAVSVTTTGDLSGSQYLQQICVYPVEE